MSRILVFTVFSFLLLSGSYGGDLKRVKKAIEKADYEKAEKQIINSLNQNPTNPGIKYYYSVLFFSKDFHRFNVDSARTLVNDALIDLEKASEKQLEELANEHITEQKIQDQLTNITTYAFEEANSHPTIASWKEFIGSYPDALQMDFALKQLDSLAYLAIIPKSTKSLQEYIIDYPNSKFKSSAQHRLDKMVVELHWNEKSIRDLEYFVRDNPNSEFKETALLHLLDLVVLSGDPGDFIEFGKNYPNTDATSFALDILYHLDREKEFKWFDSYVDLHPKSDSLSHIRENEDKFGFAYYIDGYTLHFKNEPSITTNLNELNTDIVCSGIVSDVIGGMDDRGDVVISKYGEVLLRGRLIKDLGNGYLLIQQNGFNHVFHKSGIQVIDKVEDAEVLRNRFIKAKRSSWGLYTLTGIPLTEDRYEEIFVEGNFWFFQVDNQLAVTTPEKIVEPFPNKLFLEFKFEDYELVSDDLLIGFKVERECLLKANGKFIVPWGIQHIYPDEQNGYIRDKKGYAFYGPQNPTYYSYLEVNEGFIVRKEPNGDWTLFSNTKDWFLSFSDSIKLVNNHCAIIAGKESKLIFQNQSIVPIDLNEAPMTLSPQSSLIKTIGELTSIYNQFGNKIFSGNFEQIQLLNDSLLMISFDEKYGVVNLSGEEILPLKYDYLSLNDGLISFIYKQSIGALDLINNNRISAIYDGKMERHGELYRTKKNGLFGLINSQEEEIIPFNYSEIIAWTDSLVWAKTEGQYELIKIQDQSILLKTELINQFHTNQGDFMKYYSSTGFGLISHSGEIIRPIYSDIIWVGTEDSGIIMADQALQGAGYHVVTYFDSSGVKLLSQAYTNQDFEKVLCDR